MHSLLNGRKVFPFWRKTSKKERKKEYGQYEITTPSPAVSHHLRPLKNSGLIVCRREGKEVYYRAADTEQGRLLHQMIEQVMEITCPEL